MEIKDVEVLVVDDVKVIRQQTKDMLFTTGFRKVTLKESGEAAIQHLAQQPCHIILSDWHMYPISGLELLKWVRENLKITAIPFVMCTAEKTQDLVLEAVNLGIDDYIVKPLTVQQIQIKVLGALKKRKFIQ